MSYIPTTPRKKGKTQLKNIDLKEIANFIDWRFFFHTWKLIGRFHDIHKACDCLACEMGWLQQFSEKERPKAKEALKLYKDARTLLQQIIEEQSMHINAIVYIQEAYAIQEDIIITKNKQQIKIPTLRQQQPASDGYYYALSDFISPQKDYIGLFATTVIGAEEIAQQYEQKDDTYYAILTKSIADRLAEAAAEWLHYKVRTEYWGYEKKGEVSIENMLKSKYRGIRPAVGYPSLPDQSIIFDLNHIIQYQSIGIQLTENGAMYPNASVSGLYIAHPKAKYFMVGKIDQAQLENYAQRRHTTSKEISKWLAANL